MLGLRIKLVLAVPYGVMCRDVPRNVSTGAPKKTYVASAANKPVCLIFYTAYRHGDVVVGREP